jgi:thymidylate kinase
MKRGKIICFIGIDGSGKTTLAKFLVTELQKRGKRISYIYGRYEPRLIRFIMSFAKMIFFRKKDMFDDYTDYSKTKKNAIKNHLWLAAIYQRALLLEYYIQFTYRIGIPLYISKKNVVFDRYIFDTIVTDLAIDFNYSADDIDRILTSIFHVFPLPDVLFMIDVPVETAFKRKNDVPSIDYLLERRLIYQNIGSKYNAIIIDGTKSLEEIKNQVVLDVEVILNE